MKKDFLTLTDLSRDEAAGLLIRAAEFKAMRQGGRAPEPLAGKSVAMIFLKSSTRTRVSFEVGIRELGGYPLILSKDGTQLSRGEPWKDTARVLSGYVHGIVIRAFDHAEVEELARWATVPVINALTDRYHPCQVLADLFTLFEAGLLKTGLRVAFIGDGYNNMVHSWINAARLFELHLAIACPPAYRPDPAIVAAAGEAVTVLEDPKQAAADADVLYTDVWVSMGQEEEKAAREKAFRGYQINADLIARAKPLVRIMHCLPAHRGEEITEEALEGPHSLVFAQSENRLHVQKAILERLLAGQTFLSVKGSG